MKFVLQCHVLVVCDCSLRFMVEVESICWLNILVNQVDFAKSRRTDVPPCHQKITSQRVLFKAQNLQL